MKLEFTDNNHFIIYLMKNIIKKVDFNNKDDVEKYFQKLFKRLKKYYHIDIQGYYSIKMYLDKYYGIVLDIQKEDIDYYDYLTNTVDMKVTTIETSFMYEIKDLNIVQKLKSSVRVYKYHNKLYIQLIELLNEQEMMMLMENSLIIYNNEKEKFMSLNIDKFN